MISKGRLKGLSVAFVVAAAVALRAPAAFEAAQSAGDPAAQAASVSQPSLDYEFFKTRVEPIFLKKRSPNHARCYVCHEKSNHPPCESMAGACGILSLEPLSPGSSFWTEEQSRLNFKTVSKLVVPGNPDASMFPMHPLAPEAGGGNQHKAHTGGRQFESQNDPDFQTVVEWIRGQKASGSSGPIKGDAAKGKEIFEENCEICHEVSDQDKVGPGLKGISMKGPHKLSDGTEHKDHSPEVLHKQIVQGGGAMPPVGASFSDKEVDDVIEYLMKL
jgi:cytochrome c5